MNISEHSKLSVDLCRAIVDSAPDAILVLDLNWHIRHTNQLARQLLHYNLGELEHLRFSQIAPGFTPDLAEEYLKRLTNSEIIRFEIPLLRKDGSISRNEIKISGFKNKNSLQLLAFCREIPSVREAEDTLPGEKVLMDALMNNIHDSIFFKDREGRLIRVNKKMVQDLNVNSEKDILGKTDAELFGEEFGRKTMAIEQEIIRTGTPRPGLIESRILPDGKMNWTLTTKVPLFGPDGTVTGIAGITKEINNLKEAEGALRLKEYQLSMASEIADLGYWEYNVINDQYTFNDHFYKVYRTSAEEMGGYYMSHARFSELFLHPEDSGLIAKEIQEAVNTKDPNFNKHLEHRIKYLNGETGYVSVNFYVVKDEKGRTIKSYGANQIITKRKLAEKARLEQETQLRIAAKMAKLGYWEYYTRENQVLLNDQFYEMHRTSAKAIGGYRITPEKYSDLFLTPGDYQRILEEGKKAIKSESSAYNSYIEFQVFFPNGDVGMMGSYFTMLKDENNWIYKTIGVSQDITERKRTEMVIKEKESNLQKAFEIAAMGPYRYNIQEDQFEWSQRALRVIGFHKDQEPHDFQSLLDMVHYSDRDYLRKRAKEGRSSGRLDVEVRINIKGTLKWLRFKSHKEYDEDRRPLNSIGIVQDITKRKLAEMELAQYRDHLEQLVTERTIQLENTNKDLEAFAYSISHDLRAPLRHINGFATILRKQLGNSSEDLREYINLIIGSSRRMGTMIDGLLHFSRLGRQKLTKSDVDLNKMVREVIRNFRPDTDHRQISWDINSLPTIKGDPELLKIVFENLISNAIKYTQTRPNTVIEINSLPDPEHNCCIYIKDNGVGFNMNYADKLFGVFQRLHNEEEFEGTGIGLAHAQQIVKRHGGNIRATAEPGKGATFFVTL